jgi:hypothetical protein
MGLRPTHGDESPLTCHSERSEESACPSNRKSRFLVATLLGMTGLG